MIFDPSRDEDPAARQPSARDRWQLAGGIAHAYERYLVPVLFAPWAERLVVFPLSPEAAAGNGSTTAIPMLP